MTPVGGDDGLPFVPSHDFAMPVNAELDEEARVNLYEYLRRMIGGEVFKESRDYVGSEIELANVHVSECYSCKKLTLWRHDTILYPAHLYEMEPNSDLPGEIRRDFDEARGILNLSPRGAAALLRLCIQKLCIHLGKPGKNIDADIASLVADGLNVQVQKALDIVRVIGNEAVHPGQMELTDDRATAATLFDLVNQIAYDTITHPKELETIYQKLPPSKREAIGKRDAPKK